MAASPEPFVRPYRATDRDAVYDVCVRTGDAGGDATGKYPEADVLPDIYAGPYLYLEPQLAFVLDAGPRAVGYVLGTADTVRFVERFREEWLPTLAGKYPPPTGSPTSPYEWALEGLYRPERMLVPELSCYPAHLHIDLLPDYQRAGHGRQLIEAFIAGAVAAGAGGTHVAVARSNTGAHRFYQRVGFERVEVPGLGEPFFFGRKHAQEASPPG